MQFSSAGKPLTCTFQLYSVTSPKVIRHPSTEAPNNISETIGCQYWRAILFCRAEWQTIRFALDHRGFHGTKMDESRFVHEQNWKTFTGLLKVWRWNASNSVKRSYTQMCAVHVMEIKENIKTTHWIGNLTTQTADWCVLKQPWTFCTPHMMVLCSVCETLLQIPWDFKLKKQKRQITWAHKQIFALTRGNALWIQLKIKNPQPVAAMELIHDSKLNSCEKIRPQSEKRRKQKSKVKCAHQSKSRQLMSCCAFF